MDPFHDTAALGLTVRRLEQGDAGSLLEFCHRCSEFFELVEGAPPSAETVRDLLETVPAGISRSAKLLLGVHRAGDLVGILELVDGYPQLDDWYLGTMLLVPEERNRGTGTDLFEKLLEWLAGQDCRSLRLVVHRHNPGAVRFWRRLGFSPSSRVPDRPVGADGRTELVFSVTEQN